jgi:predicted RND superfamily exporter protein
MERITRASARIRSTLPTIPPISSWTERYVRFLRKRAGWIVISAVLLCAASTLLAWRLDLRTDLAELLPNKDPSVQELRRLQSRLPGLQALLVNIRSPNKTANLDFAQKLVAKVRALPPDLVQLAAADIRTERAWFEQRKWLYPTADDLEKMRDRLEREIQKKKNPLFVSLDDDDDESLEAMEKRFESHGAGGMVKRAIDSLPGDAFVTKDGQTAMVVILPPGGVFHEHAGEQLVGKVMQLVGELEPAKSGIDVGLSGDIESVIEERNALENDLVWATGLCVALVCGVVIFFYGRLRAVPLMAAPALVGTCVAFGIAELAFGYLNSSTAFLASIIVGNGINFAIIQLARYEEERSIGVVPEVALVRSVAATWRATAIAALAASISYGSLVLTRFRGFSQFGVIGGVGMVLAWLATMTVLPSVVWLLDRRGKGKTKAKRARGPIFADGVARLATRAPRKLIVAGVVITIAAIALLPRYLRDPFEYNFKNLRSAISESGKGEGRYYNANMEVFGRTLSPTVILVDRDEQVGWTKQALAEADKHSSGEPMIARVVTLDDFLPGSAAEQQKKLEVLAGIRKLAHDPSFKLLDDDERAKVQKYLPPENLSPVAVTDLPASVRRPFTELDGTMGHVLLVLPKDEGYDPWNGRDLIRLSERVTDLRLPDGSTVRSASTAVVFAGMIRSIVHDGPRATLASALGVILLVIGLARGFQGAGLVLGTLAAGILWMLGGAAGLNLRINFLNFVAIPVTLGIGVDYGINIYLRYKLEGPGRLYAAVRATGGAVALCSATTIIGYGALLVADNRGLRSFGEMAILGEFACLAAALVFMPALLALREQKLGLARRLEAEGSATTLGKVRTETVDTGRSTPPEKAAGAETE